MGRGDSSSHELSLQPFSRGQFGTVLKRQLFNRCLNSLNTHDISLGSGPLFAIVRASAIEMLNTYI